MLERLRNALSYANVVGTLALFIALGGVSYAAVKLPAGSVGNKQLKSNAVTSAKIRNGTLKAHDFKKGQLPRSTAGEQGQDGQPGDTGTAGERGERGLPGTKGEQGDAGASGSAGHNGLAGNAGRDGEGGPAGPPGPAGTAGQAGKAGGSGPPGPAGAPGSAGAPGPTGVVTTARISGFIASIAADAGVYQFLGSQATVTTTALQRLTASAMVPIGVSGPAQTIHLDMCYQSTAGGAVNPFAGGGYSLVAVSTTRTAQAATGTVMPGAGSWRVGACAMTTATLDNNDFVNGFVQVTN